MTQPTDDTQPHPTVPPPQANVLSTPAGATPVGDPPPASPTPPEAAPQSTPAGTTLQAAPPPATPSDWREPPWSPPRSRPGRGPSMAAIVFGGLILLVGIWFFIERTLGIELPDIRWGTLWPILLIALGGVILLRAANRR
jgi:hypothetical protein